jgi:hypothetical protein
MYRSISFLPGRLKVKGDDGSGELADATKGHRAHGRRRFPSRHITEQALGFSSLKSCGGATSKRYGYGGYASCGCG